MRYIKNIIIVLVVFSFFISKADDHLKFYTELKYNTPSDCFATGIKRVFVPFPGWGTFACIKDAIKQLPEYDKSANLLAGHATGLMAAGFTSSLLLLIGAWLKIPGAKKILGPEITKYLVTIPKKVLKSSDTCG